MPERVVTSAPRVADNPYSATQPDRRVRGLWVFSSGAGSSPACGARCIVSHLDFCWFGNSPRMRGFVLYITYGYICVFGVKADSEHNTPLSIVCSPSPAAVLMGVFSLKIMKEKTQEWLIRISLAVAAIGIVACSWMLSITYWKYVAKEILGSVITR